MCVVVVVHIVKTLIDRPLKQKKIILLLHIEYQI